MRRLLPTPDAEVSVDEAYAAPLGEHSDRPWVSLCMVASIDGSTVVDGASAQLSSPTDSAVLHQLRQIADVIVVGAGTVREEGYGPPRKPGQRVGVVSGSGNVDLESELFASGAGFLITIEQPRRTAPPGVDVLRAGVDVVDLDRALTRLPDLVPGCRTVQVEGGAALNAGLLSADLLDEMNITTSPVTAGGTGPRLASGAPQHAHRFDIAQIAVDEQAYVYSRWLRRRGG